MKYSILVVALSGLYGCKIAPNTSPTPESQVESADFAALNNDFKSYISSWTTKFTSTKNLPSYQGLEPVEFKIDEVEKFLVPGSKTNTPNLPATLEGLWWFDGNPLADKVMTLKNVEFFYTPEGTKNDLGGTLVGRIPVYAAGQYTFDANRMVQKYDPVHRRYNEVLDQSGYKLWEGARNFKLVYELHFTSDQQHATIFPVVHIPLIFNQNFIIKLPTWAVEFTMTFRRDGVWQRDSFFFGRRINQYRFTRIVNPDGTRNNDDGNDLNMMPFSDSPVVDLRHPYQRYLDFTRSIGVEKTITFMKK